MNNSGDLDEAARAAWVEKLRQSGIEITRDGLFFHEGAPVEHEGLRRALFRWLDRLPDGRYVLRLDEKRFAYVGVADTPIVVRNLTVNGAGEVRLYLSDGSEEALDVSTLTLDDVGVLRCWVRNHRLEARLATAAAAELVDHIRLGPGEAGAVLELGGQRFVLPTRS